MGPIQQIDNTKILEHGPIFREKSLKVLLFYQRTNQIRVPIGLYIKCVIYPQVIYLNCFVND